MTEKIIIDGVNVAGCYLKCEDGDCAVYYADLSTDNNELVYGFNCEDNPNCYYKQLQRLKQENEKLKEKIESYNCNANCYKYKEANKYKQVLEEIRQFCGCYSENDIAKPIFEVILNIIDGDSEVLTDDEIPF